MLGIAPFILALAPVPAAVPIAGLYRSHQAEIGAALELSGDGRFRYQLEYGVISEGGEGDWSSDGPSVTLTSNPMPEAPCFVLVRDEPLPPGKLSIQIIEPESEWLKRIDALVAIDGAAAMPVRFTGDEIVDIPSGRSAVVTPLVPFYGDPAGRFPISLAAGHRLLLRFDARDLGRVRFDHERLTLDDGALLLNRYDAAIRLERAEN